MIKVIQNTSIENSGPRYITPKANVIFVKAHGILCQSGNESLREYDYGDAGFGEI